MRLPDNWLWSNAHRLYRLVYLWFVSSLLWVAPIHLPACFRKLTVKLYESHHTTDELITLTYLLPVAVGRQWSSIPHTGTNTSITVRFAKLKASATSEGGGGGKDSISTQLEASALSASKISLTEPICCIWSKLLYYQHQTGYEQQTGCTNDPRPYHAVPTRHLQPGHHRKRPSAPTLPKPATGRFGIPPVPNVKGRKPSLSDWSGLSSQNFERRGITIKV